MAFHFLDGKDDLFGESSTEDVAWVEKILYQLKLMYDNADSRVTNDSIISDNFIYRDENISINIISQPLAIHIVGIMDERTTLLVHTQLRYGTFEHIGNGSSSYVQVTQPIKWQCSDECKNNTIKYINDHIFDKTYEPLQVQFCKKLANVVKEQY